MLKVSTALQQVDFTCRASRKFKMATLVPVTKQEQK